MSQPEEEGCADIRVALAKVRYVPYHVRLLAVQAELEEAAKPKRDIEQKRLAALYGVTARMLRYWVVRYLAEGAEGLRARGGQGRKRDVSREDVARAIDECLESNEVDGGDGDGGGISCGPCLEEDAGGGGPRAGRRAPPGACECNGKCVKPSKCECKAGKVCRCKCCRPLKPPPKGPRHASGCTRHRSEPTGATRAVTVRDRIAAKHGKRYHLHHVYKLMDEDGVTYHKLSKSQENHAGVGAARAWQWRQEERLRPYRKKGYVVGVFDVAFFGMDGATGRMWIRRGCKATLPGGRSRQVVAVHGIYFEDDTHTVREYSHADSRTLIDFLEDVSARVPKMILYADRSSINSSKETRKALRELRRRHPDRDVRIFLLPVGSPYLSVIEAFWNLLKDAVTKRYRYKTFMALRWAVMDRARTMRVRLGLYKFLYRNPKKNVPPDAKA